MSSSHTPSDRPGRGSARRTAVPRPRGVTLDAIEREGISWEGQVFIVGHDGDIPAILYITSDRFLLTQRDTILLEVPRTWLVPAPLRVEDDAVRFSITPEGVMPGRDTTERLLLRVLEGRGPAGQLIAILTGRARHASINAEFPTWSSGVGAGRASSLPPLPAFEISQDAPPARPSAGADPETRGVAPIDAWETGQPERQPVTPRIPFTAPEPEPVAPQSRAARFLSDRSAVAGTAPAEPEHEAPVNITHIETERRRRGAGAGVWVTRIAMLAIIVLVAGWFARPYLPDEVSDQLPAFLSDDTSDPDTDQVAVEQPARTDTGSTTASEGDGTNGAGAEPADIMPTETALGVGGATSEIPDAESIGETTETLPEAPPTGNEPAGQGATEAAQEQPAIVATEAPVEPEPTEPPVVEQPLPTEAPEEPVATEIPEQPLPTEEPVVETPMPTEIPATEAPVPTEVPVTQEPVATEIPATEIPATEIPATEIPATEAPEAPAATEPALESQPPSVNPEQPPAQEFATNGIRYSIEGATSGASLPELPEIAEISYGEWIVLALDAQNVTGAEQVFDMREFTLLADGEPIQVDVGNSWVASMMGYTPAYGNTDAILWAPGEQHQFVLTFLAPTGAQSLVLQAGDQQFDLTPVLETAPALNEMQEGTDPEPVEATVVEVVDGETIVIERDGIQQTVHYLGVDAPAGDACYAAEATEANRALVEGQSVRIERQATDVDAQGNWVRDVWVQQDDGTWVLAAHRLVQDGAATADISEPNTRFASWLRGADAAAQAEGRGLWGACQQGDAPVTAPVVAQPADHVRWLTS